MAVQSVPLGIRLELARCSAPRVSRAFLAAAQPVGPDGRWSRVYLTRDRAARNSHASHALSM